MNNTAAANAVKAALSIYAESLGVTLTEAANLFKTNESTRECVGLLVLAQADRAGLRTLAAKL